METQDRIACISLPLFPLAARLRREPELTREALVVVEGNYLLVDSEPWDRVPALLDESWFCVTPAEERQLRLVDRHTRHGRSAEAATAWVSAVDEANARVIEASRDRADLLVSGTGGLTG